MYILNLCMQQGQYFTLSHFTTQFLSHNILPTFLHVPSHILHFKISISRMLQQYYHLVYLLPFLCTTVIIYISYTLTLHYNCIIFTFSHFQRIIKRNKWKYFYVYPLNYYFQDSSFLSEFSTSLFSLRPENILKHFLQFSTAKDIFSQI